MRRSMARPTPIIDKRAADIGRALTVKDFQEKYVQDLHTGLDERGIKCDRGARTEHRRGRCQTPEPGAWAPEARTAPSLGKRTCLP